MCRLLRFTLKKLTIFLLKLRAQFLFNSNDLLLGINRFQPALNRRLLAHDLFSQISYPLIFLFHLLLKLVYIARFGLCLSILSHLTFLVYQLARKFLNLLIFNL